MREVLFWDEEKDIKFISCSSHPTSLTMIFEGKTYPLIKVDITDIKDLD